MELMGIYEVAQLAGVSPQAVSNWVVRKANFPKPAAMLASGPVWNGRDIRDWLEQIDYVSPRKIEKGLGMDFEQDHDYLLEEICSVLGGERQSYLPQRDGRIVCGRFIQKMNPEAPKRVLVGDLPKVRRKAELMAEQKGSIPVFMKIQAARPVWRYHGMWRCEEFNTDPVLSKKLALEAERADKLAGVLVLKNVD